MSPASPTDGWRSPAPTSGWTAGKSRPLSPPISPTNTRPAPRRKSHPAYLVEDQLTIGAQLRMAGHRIVERDLVTAYGLQVVGGVIATLLGQGVAATIVCDRALSQPVREATLHAAADAIALFQEASPGELYEAGWERAGEHGWQLLLGQR